MEPAPHPSILDPMSILGETATLDEIERQLRDVEHALQRLEDGGYGICEVCGGPIDESHLEANPVARVCPDAHSRQCQR